jgi:hypothetical protein
VKSKQRVTAGARDHGQKRTQEDDMSMTQTAKDALERILALRKLTRETHVQTYKTQREILQSLNGPDLAEVSLGLSREVSL